MASAADLPPELFDGVLFYVCEYARRLLDLGTEIQDRREAIKDVAACSLTCIYWAQTCRKRMFRRIWVKSYEDLCAFSSLVLSTPKSLIPLSYYVTVATLLQRVDDRPWLYLLWAHSSRFSELLRADYIYIHVVESPESTLAKRRPTLSRLFARLPKAPPSSCHQCDALVIESPHFRSASDLRLLLSHFSYRPGNLTLSLSNGSWDPQAHLNSDVLTREAVEIFPRSASITIEGCPHSAETAWLAFCTVLGRRMRYKPKAVSASSSRGELSLHVSPTAQRFILAIVNVIGRDETMLPLQIFCKPWTSVAIHNLALRQVCSLSVRKYKGALPSLGFSFYASLPVVRTANNDIRRVPINDITHVCVSIAAVPKLFPTRSNIPSTSENHALWEAMVPVLCSTLQRDVQLQLSFRSRNDLLQFMEETRPALAKLTDRVSLFHEVTGPKDARAVSFVTLADIGAAKDHGFINSFR